MDFTKFQQEMKDLDQQRKSRSREIFTEATKEIFDAHPGLESFSWTQYTPYFNDGDTCYFQVNTENISVNGVAEYDEDEDDDDDHIPEVSPLITLSKNEKNEIRNQVVKMLDSIENGILQSIFGDHSRVVVTRDGTNAEDYSRHD